MAIWHEEKQECFVIHVDEEDLADEDLDRIRQVLTVAFLHKRYNLILDISVCRMVDSYFIGLLISTYREVRELGGNLRIVGANEQVWHAFEVIRLNRVMDICEDMDEALSRFAEEIQGGEVE